MLPSPHFCRMPSTLSKAAPAKASATATATTSKAGGRAPLPVGLQRVGLLPVPLPAPPLVSPPSTPPHLAAHLVPELLAPQPLAALPVGSADRWAKTTDVASGGRWNRVKAGTVASSTSSEQQPSTPSSSADPGLVDWALSGRARSDSSKSQTASSMEADDLAKLGDGVDSITVGGEPDPAVAKGRLGLVSCSGEECDGAPEKWQRFENSWSEEANAYIRTCWRCIMTREKLGDENEARYWIIRHAPGSQQQQQ